MMKDFHGDGFKQGMAVHCMYQSTMYPGIVVKVNPKSIKVRIKRWMQHWTDIKKTYTEETVIIATQEQLIKIINKVSGFKDQYDNIQKQLNDD